MIAAGDESGQDEPADGQPVRFILSGLPIEFQKCVLGGAPAADGDADRLPCDNHAQARIAGH